jgi:hypothetical protein
MKDRDRYRVIINTAKALRITIRPSVLLPATGIIP